jgi:squalene-hopene/tetraprenyl-beta-curcumene cyclase
MSTYEAMLSCASDQLLARQRTDGSWFDPMRSNAGVEAEDLLIREFLGIRTDATTAITARWLRHTQDSAGFWADYPGGPGNLSITIEAYVALRLAGDTPDEPHMTRAAEYCRAMGGIARSRTGTRLWLALLGQVPWQSVPVMLPEQLFTPARSPLSIYGFAAWTRAALVPLTVISAHQPVRRLSFMTDELHADGTKGAGPIAASPVVRAIMASDKLMQRYQRHPFRPLRRNALRVAEQQLIHRQEYDGSWFGIHIITAFGAIALHALGYDTRHPVMKAAISRLDDFGVVDEIAGEPVRRVTLCPGHVWDTALAMIALADAGLPDDHPALAAAADWLLGQESHVRGDWALRRPGLAASGWPFTADACSSPDCDDTAGVIRALQRVRPADGRLRDRVEQARQRGIGWLLGLQSKEGGWATYDIGRVSRLSKMVARLPFNDFGPVLDPPWGGDLTGHVLEMLGHEGLGSTESASRARQWLAGTQENDGSWFGRWGTNHVYGTGAAIPGLIAAGTDPGSLTVTRAIQWLTDHQNPDGGWGESCQSYSDPKQRGRGVSTPSQTSWALLAFHAVGVEASDPRVTSALNWLAGGQTPDGGWDEEEFTGTGHPGELFFGYPMYSLTFPLMAIGRYVNKVPPTFCEARSSSKNASRETAHS